eukprot:TRINITY_DN1708_c0_g1_i1.p1 TRINITY_DN1708_c0_g1~~TRINITY_DN1708_c0_g1_i1.p1  ORF type:complete len:996 (+),score=173.57 TRINITY_DN1708_c0_g1_i1:418-2988(+)
MEIDISKENAHSAVHPIDENRLVQMREETERASNFNNPHVSFPRQSSSLPHPTHVSRKESKGAGEELISDLCRISEGDEQGHGGAGEGKGRKARQTAKQLREKVSRSANNAYKLERKRAMRSRKKILGDVRVAKRLKMVMSACDTAEKAWAAASGTRTEGGSEPEVAGHKVANAEEGLWKAFEDFVELLASPLKGVCWKAGKLQVEDRSAPGVRKESEHLALHGREESAEQDSRRKPPVAGHNDSKFETDARMVDEREIEPDQLRRESDKQIVDEEEAERREGEGEQAREMEQEPVLVARLRGGGPGGVPGESQEGWREKGASPHRRRNRHKGKHEQARSGGKGDRAERASEGDSEERRQRRDRGEDDSGRSSEGRDGSNDRRDEQGNRRHRDHGEGAEQRRERRERDEGHRSDKRDEQRGKRHREHGEGAEERGRKGPHSHGEKGEGADRGKGRRRGDEGREIRGSRGGEDTEKKLSSDVFRSPAFSSASAFSKAFGEHSMAPHGNEPGSGMAGTSEERGSGIDGQLLPNASTIETLATVKDSSEALKDLPGQPHPATWHAALIPRLNSSVILQRLACLMAGWLHRCLIVGVSCWPIEIERYGKLAEVIAVASVERHEPGKADDANGGTTAGYVRRVGAPLKSRPEFGRGVFRMLLEKLVQAIPGEVDKALVPGINLLGTQPWLFGLADTAYEEEDYVKAITLFLQTGALSTANYTRKGAPIPRSIFTPWVLRRLIASLRHVGAAFPAALLCQMILPEPDLDTAFQILQGAPVIGAREWATFVDCVWEVPLLELLVHKHAQTDESRVTDLIKLLQQPVLSAHNPPFVRMVHVETLQQVLLQRLAGEFLIGKRSPF